ncbi:M20_dimer domain-containing protein [Haematococcus lacustris]|uniref:M20_dimer domain-containing protein n=1 Tax=Haematococcus lacustris TaxID=44745 RepID=A0A6A0A5M7_HAELA|nr:M20_dimer domain-containing protein [Haematococcus lacustris]
MAASDRFALKRPIQVLVVSVTQVAAAAVVLALQPVGTIRALSLATFERLRRRVAEVANLTAATYGCSITDLQWSATPYPPTVNDAGMADLALAVAASLGAASRAMGDAQEWGDVGAEDLAEPSMAAEDFAFYAAKVPSVMTWLGIGDAALGTDVSLHNPHFQMDESQLALGAALHATLALAYLQQHQHLAPGLQPEGRSGPQLQPDLAVDTLVASQQGAGHADLSPRPTPEAISPLQQHDDL